LSLPKPKNIVNVALPENIRLGKVTRTRTLESIIQKWLWILSCFKTLILFSAIQKHFRENATQRKSQVATFKLI
jgi:hypothetical protein